MLGHPIKESCTWTQVDVERLLDLDRSGLLLSGATAGTGAIPCPTPDIATRALLRLTTSRHDPTKCLPAEHRPLFIQLAHHGWLFRDAWPRYYQCWRNSALMLKSRSRIVIFPHAATDLAIDQRSVFLMFELLRRLARVRLIEDGKPARIADCASVTKALAGVVAREVFGHIEAAERCISLVCDTELAILEAVVGWPVRKSAAKSAFLPRHLSRW